MFSLPLVRAYLECGATLDTKAVQLEEGKDALIWFTSSTPHPPLTSVSQIVHDS